MTKTFVTGGTGFIGSAVVKRLRDEGYQIITLKGEIRNPSWIKKAKGCDFILHFAGVHGFRRMPFKERLSIELGGTKNLVKAVKISGAKLIYLSTAYSNMATDYAKTKNIAKKYLLKEIKKGLPATIVCPVSVYGPGPDKNIRRLINLVLTGRFFFVGNGKNTWHFIYIDDLVEAIILIIKNFNKTNGETYIISQGKPIQLIKLVDLIAKEAGIKVRKIFLPKTLMKVLGKIFFRDAVTNMTVSQNYPLSRGLINLGFRPKVGLVEGIRKTLDEKNSG